MMSIRWLRQHIIDHITSGNAHAYIKSQFDRYDVSQLAAEKALDAWEKSVRPAMPRRPCPRTEENVSTALCALADFDGIYYGKGYLTFLKGDTIVKLLKPGGIDAEGWACGKVNETSGWFPPAYAA